MRPNNRRALRQSASICARRASTSGNARSSRSRWTKDRRSDESYKSRWRSKTCVSITGHTSASKAPPKADYGPWKVSADRANAVRQILEEEGFPPGNIYEVAGRADTDPLFPEDPYIAANRRVTITLMHEAPPVPPRLQP